MISGYLPDAVEGFITVHNRNDEHYSIHVIITAHINNNNNNNISSFNAK